MCEEERKCQIGIAEKVIQAKIDAYNEATKDLK